MMSDIQYTALARVGCTVNPPLNFTRVGLNSKRLAPRGTEKLHAISQEPVCLNKDTDRHSVVTDTATTDGE